MVKAVQGRTREQCYRGIMGLEGPRYGQPRYVNQTVSPEVWRPRYHDRGAEFWRTDCGDRGSLPRSTELTIIVRVSYSLCRDRRISPYPGSYWSGSPDYPGIAMPGCRSQRFSLSSSVCYGIGEDCEVPVRGVLCTYL